MIPSHRQIQSSTLTLYLKWVTCGDQISLHPKRPKTPMHNNNVIKPAVPSPSSHCVLPEASFHALLSRRDENKKLSEKYILHLLHWWITINWEMIKQHNTNINPCDMPHSCMRSDIPSLSLCSSLHSYPGLCPSELYSSHPVVENSTGIS